MKDGNKKKLSFATLLAAFNLRLLLPALSPNEAYEAKVSQSGKAEEGIWFGGKHIVAKELKRFAGVISSKCPSGSRVIKVASLEDPSSTKRNLCRILQIDKQGNPTSANRR